MKKNLMTLIILAILIVNTVMTGVMMFVVVPANQKTMQLVGDISSAIQLDLGIAGSGALAQGGSNIALSDIQPYNIEDQLTVKLKSEGEESGDHFAVVGVTLSLNTKNDDYKTYNAETLASYKGLMQDKIDKVIGTYTYNEIETQAVTKQDIQDRILEELQSMFNSQVICDVSFSTWLLQ